METRQEQHLAWEFWIQLFSSSLYALFPHLLLVKQRFHEILYCFLKLFQTSVTLEAVLSLENRRQVRTESALLALIW